MKTAVFKLLLMAGLVCCGTGIMATEISEIRVFYEAGEVEVSEKYMEPLTKAWNDINGSSKIKLVLIVAYGDPNLGKDESKVVAKSRAENIKNVLVGLGCPENVIFQVSKTKNYLYATDTPEMRASCRLAIVRFEYLGSGDTPEKKPEPGAVK